MLQDWDSQESNQESTLENILKVETREHHTLKHAPNNPTIAPTMAALPVLRWLDCPRSQAMPPPPAMIFFHANPVGIDMMFTLLTQLKTALD